MARKTKINYDVFDNEQDNLSDLVKMFTKKTKRCKKIFEDDDDLPLNNDKSYGLRLVSMEGSKSNEQIEKSSDKENLNEVSRKTSNVRLLSPVPIVAAPIEQISENRSPFKHPSQKQNRPNSSLRRSLFQQPESSKNMVCSTPCTSNTRKNDFFGSAAKGIDSLSPIRKGLSSTVINDDDMRGLQVIPASADKDNRGSIALKNIENDLRQQFEINERTPKRARSVAAERVARNSISKDIQASPAHSEPVGKSTNITVKNCSVALGPMEISKETISMYQKQQMSRLSMSNRTNVNTINMIETPIIRQAKKSNINDSALARKLALCESDSDEMTDDEASKEPQLTEDESQEKVVKEKKRDQSKQKSLSQHPSARKSSTRTSNRISSQQSLKEQTVVESDESEEEESSAQQKTSTESQPSESHQESNSDETESDQEASEQIHTELSSQEAVTQNDESSGSQSEEYQDASEQVRTESSSQEAVTQNDESSGSNSESENEPGTFKVPNGIAPSRYTAITSNLSTSGNSLVPSDIVKSFRTLQKPSNETTVGEASQSLKVSIPKRKRGPKPKLDENKKKMTEYLELEGLVKKKARKKNVNRKRTLFTQRSILEDEIEQNLGVAPQEQDASHTGNDSDEELKLTVENIQRSLEQSTASSLLSEFGQTEQRNDVKEKTPAKKATKRKHTEPAPEEEEVELPDKEQEESVKKRGRPRKASKNKEPVVEPAKTVKKPSKAPKRTATEEPPVKNKRLKRIVRQVESSDDEENENEASDEGFETERDENIRYDPYERGCQRPGLRVRRYMRANWIHSGPLANALIEYGTQTKDDVKAWKLQQKYKISNTKLPRDNTLNPLPAKVRIEMLEKIHKEELKNKKITNKRKLKKPEEVDQEDGAGSSASFNTVRTAETHADIVNRVFENFNQLNHADENETETMSEITEEYHMAQINKLVWTFCSEGVWYSGFEDNGTDGFFKFEGGAHKALAKPRSTTKFTLLCGKLEFLVSGKPVNLSNLGYICIQQKQPYEVRNPSRETAILLTTRMDELRK